MSLDWCMLCVFGGMHEPESRVVWTFIPFVRGYTRSCSWSPYIKTCYMAEVDLCSADPVPWIREVRQAYESLRLRRSAIADVYTGYAQELHHYCDGDTTRQRFRPKDLASAKTVPPFRHLVDDSSMKPPAQRQLASIVHHEGWLACYEANQAADSAAAASGTDTRRLREATRIVGTSQPRAGSILRELPTSPDTRRQSSRWLWAMQRRYGLYVSQALPTFALLASQGDTRYDPLGDHIAGEGETDRSAPHRAALRQWHGAHQATAAHAIVLGDKAAPELYAIYNTGCVVDLAEERMGKGGTDRCVELKVYTDLVASGISSPNETTYRGDTHAFGNTEEILIRKVLGVAARDGGRRWDASAGEGKVAAHHGDYHDAITNKRNTTDLVLHNPFGGFAPGAERCLRMLSKRSIDTTVYENWAAADYCTYWGQRISGAIVIADAERCFKRLDALRGSARAAHQPATQRRTGPHATPHTGRP